jgi:metallo-beta-lactamase family protein
MPKGEMLSLRIQFIGGVRTVTGSMHCVTNGEYRLLIDCGLFQGHREEYYTRNSRFPFDPATIDACILSHAHIDHSGNIPNLVKQGFRRDIVTTNATSDLCSAMLPDSGHIQEEDVKFVNKIHKKKGLPPRKPLYTRRDAEACLELFNGHPYHRRIELDGGAAVTFFDAGHVLGSAIPMLELRDGDATRRIAYAVDLGRENIPILGDPETPPGIEYLFLESTYGGRLHASADEAKGKLAEIVNRTVERGGKIIIPSFALERTQEVAYHLQQLTSERRIPDIPIYVDSPLAVNITEVFLRHPECYDEEMHRAFRSGADPLGTRRIKYITDVNDSKSLNRESKPMIIISASGMCEAGRILHHLKNNIENPKNTVLVVGYMAQDTLGRRIVERHKEVKIFGTKYKLRAEVAVINAFSAHADRNELLDYVQPLKGTLRKIFIVHGEEDQSMMLHDLLKENGFPAYVPTPGEEMEIS